MSSSLLSARWLWRLVLVSCVCLFSQAGARDTISLAEPVRDGQTLVSSGEKIVLGFFSPGNSSARRYVGIWCNRYPSETILWVANRDNPLPDDSGMFAISDKGNLVVLDGAGNEVWTSNVTVSSNGSMAQLLDSGNLRLNDSGKVVWQSFDHPTDSYLPGMEVGLDLRTNVLNVFTSWRRTHNPAVCRFSMGNGPGRSTQMVMWDGERIRWRPRPFDGQDFIRIPVQMSSNVYGMKLGDFRKERKIFFYFDAYNGSARFLMKWDGTMEYQQWNETAGNWDSLWAEPLTECELYNRCGPHASCSDEQTPMCRCLPGFVPVSEQEWREGNWTKGCTRRTPLQCERNATVSLGGGGSNGTDEVKADWFYKLEGVKVPNLADWVAESTEEPACVERCRRNCTCKAYAFVYGVGCLHWGVDLVDIHKFAVGGKDMHLRLAGSEETALLRKEEGESEEKVPEFLWLFFLIGIAYLIWKMNEINNGLLRQSKTDERPTFSQAGTSGRMRRGFSTILQLREGEDDGKVPDLQLLTFDFIVLATDGFSDSNFLGEGGFGPVYKGKLADGQEIAVKRLSSNSGQGTGEFKNEVTLIAKLQHRNLVRPLGCCCERGEKILVYEYMPNRSLDVFLFDVTMRKELDWRTRYNIIEGIARGLLYLHRDSRFRIIHRDLKASNILLDEGMNPKISDFGMARMFWNNDNPTNTNHVAGTYGYMSPEYAMHGLFSVKSDVYSFGVLLLEIISGQRNSTFTDPQTYLNLLAYAWHLWNQDRAIEFVDESIRGACSHALVSRCISLALLCVQDRAIDRPSIASVVTMLESETIGLVLPRKPTFTADRTFGDSDSSTAELKAATAEVSITVITGR